MMRISIRGLRSLSWPFILGFVVIWNALNYLAIWLNGGPGMYNDPRALAVVAATCLVTSALSFGIVTWPRLRGLVTADQRLEYFEPSPFLFIGAIAGLMGALMAYDAVLGFNA
jgi:hypothetical protein